MIVVVFIELSLKRKLNYQTLVTIVIQESIIFKKKLRILLNRFQVYLSVLSLTDAKINQGRLKWSKIQIFLSKLFFLLFWHWLNISFEKKTLWKFYFKFLLKGSSRWNKTLKFDWTKRQRKKELDWAIKSLAILFLKFRFFHLCKNETSNFICKRKISF